MLYDTKSLNRRVPFHMTKFPILTRPNGQQVLYTTENPFSETWYCVECVKNYSEAYLKYQKDLSKKPWDVDDYEMEFLKSFTYSGITTQLGKKTS